MTIDARSRLRKGPLWPAKRDFDMLPRSAEIDVQPARRHELSAIAEMGNRMVPGVQISEPDLGTVFRVRSGQHSDVQPASRSCSAPWRFSISTAEGMMLSFCTGNESDIIPTSTCLPLAPTRCRRSMCGRSQASGKAMAGLGNVSKHLARTTTCGGRSVRATVERGRARFDDRNRLRADTELLSPNSGVTSGHGIAVLTNARAVTSVGSFADARH